MCLSRRPGTRGLQNETCFVFIIHTSVGDYLHVALMVAEHRPGCDRPMNELQICHTACCGRGERRTGGDSVREP